MNPVKLQNVLKEYIENEYTNKYISIDTVIQIIIKLFVGMDFYYKMN